MAQEQKMPEVAAKHSLVAKHLTEAIYNKYKDLKTKTAGCTLDQCIACAVKLENQHVGIYAADYDCYNDYSDLFNPIIEEYHGFDMKDGAHKSNMNVDDVKGNLDDDSFKINSTRIRVGRNIVGFGLSPGISDDQRKEVEKLVQGAFESFKGDEDLEGTYYSLATMTENEKQKLIDDHYLFVSGDPTLQVAGMERDWPNGRGIFLNNTKTFLVWVNEEDHLRIISMNKGGDARAIFSKLVKGIKKIEEYLKTQNKQFYFSEKVGYIHACPTNLGTGMRASVHIDLGPLKAQLGGLPELKARCKKLNLQVRSTRGESGDNKDSTVFDISNSQRLGFTEVELVQKLIDGVTTLNQESIAAAAK